MIEKEVWVLIPAYNVEMHIANLLQQLFEWIPKDNILVVNDGSTDRTGQVVREMSVNLISHSVNLGKGAALKSGFKYLERKSCEWIVTLDGDLQHSPENIPIFLNAAKEGDCDVVIGHRNRSGGDMPWDRRFSNFTTSGMLSLITGQSIPDSQCGFRLISSGFIKGLELPGQRYEFETECLLEWISRNARIGWVPISTTYNDAPSSIRRFYDTLRFVRAVVRYILLNRRK